MAKKLYNQPTSQQIMKEHAIEDWKKNGPLRDLDSAEELVLNSLNIERTNPIYTKVTAQVEQKLSQFKLS